MILRVPKDRESVSTLELEKARHPLTPYFGNKRRSGFHTRIKPDITPLINWGREDIIQK